MYSSAISFAYLIFSVDFVNCYFALNFHERLNCFAKFCKFTVEICPTFVLLFDFRP